MPGKTRKGQLIYLANNITQLEFIRKAIRKRNNLSKIIIFQKIYAFSSRQVIGHWILVSGC